MNKITVVLFLLTVGLLSCKTSESEIDKLEIVIKYYKFLNSSNASEMATLLGDSIVIRESEDDYQEYFSKKEYIEWLKWDSVFEPTYKVVEIEQENEAVKVKLSKIDKRIFFLHEEAMVWNEVIKFKNNKINRVERVEYEVFNIPKFIKNRDSLVRWIDKYHPEFSGFLNAQNESVGEKYLNAIEAYKNRGK